MSRELKEKLLEILSGNSLEEAQHAKIRGYGVHERTRNCLA